MYRLKIKKGLFLCPSVCKEEFVTTYLRKRSIPIHLRWFYPPILEASSRPKEKPVNEVKQKVKLSRKVEESVENSGNNSDDDWLTKVLLFPFKLVWWIVKAIWWIVKLIT